MIHWRKSSYSASQSETCVECACLASGQSSMVGVRDSTDPDGPRLILSPDAWGALLARLKDETFGRRRVSF
ncbi:DUF397 domain-containing protein [Actinomadura madurae]|uniref:DUF397 domain-containing protein n=1 Tax=Actinomadura madurae TaxID=1993 RepID=A0A1I5X590_9ACTN|nr:DUF397 domain-containing protein [Actinomadura madurae]SFQ26837.1 protein of unknown function [Actinomadura madurae]SPT60799.1 Domain of uncharacterised function (DUF397) [Actinomadura madurae]